MSESNRTYEGVLQVVIKHLEDNLEDKPKAPITADSNLVKELNLDSLQSFEMVADLEDHYEISIRLDELQDVETVAEVARIVHAQIQAQA